MTISYNWLHDYLPQNIEPQQLSHILTSIGLEVESLEEYTTIQGNLEGLVIGKVLTCEPHPNADKLKLTTVNIGNDQPLHIVCGAPNVAAGQKVIVATIGTTIYPMNDEPITMKKAKIRGEESEGMICAEDEIGLGESHAGILVLPENVEVGATAKDYFKPYHDWIYEIGLTPNRTDAMSHLGVAKDVCAYLSYHQKKEAKPNLPFAENFTVDNNNLPIKVTVENTTACPRYSGVSISNVTVKPSPDWLQNKLKSIGLRPINNIVDITNFVLHETGQPLHAFDADAITGNHVIIKNEKEGTPFITLDGEERKLHDYDLMICNEVEGMCIAGVFGGLKSGVKQKTKNVFLESACFNSTSIRKTSVAHNLRTDAASRFEKGTDVSATVTVLQRAALLIKEIAGGEISSDVVDVYARTIPQQKVTLTYAFLKKLSGKQYQPNDVKTILQSMGFVITDENAESLTTLVPYSKVDISLPADLVEEIVRIDGLDNIAIPSSITISPAKETLHFKEAIKEKISQQLAGLGFYEMVTNSITNSKYFTEDVLNTTVKMMNNLSADLDVLRPSMLQTGLEAIAYNINRKNNNLRFFEWGKTYHTKAVGDYKEHEHLSLYITGDAHEQTWNEKAKPFDLFSLKGTVKAVFSATSLQNISFENDAANNETLNIIHDKQRLGILMKVNAEESLKFDIKQSVYFADIYVDKWLKAAGATKIIYKEVPRFPAVQRDLAMVVNKNVSYAEIEQAIHQQKIMRLTNTRLFDIFEGEKLGEDKKSLAINFTFLDEEKTLTDKEIDGMMNRIIQSLQTGVNAEIRK